MKKLLLALFIVLMTVLPASANYFNDIIITSPDGLWTDERAYATLSDAIDVVGSDERTIILASEEVVNTLTIPSNVTLKRLRGGSITNSGTLTINTINIEADANQLFTGTGDVDFPNGASVQTAWFEDLYAAFVATNDDKVELIINSGWGAAVDTDCSVGDDVVLKWQNPYHRIVAKSGITLSNIKNIEAGNYQLFGGPGDFDFLDGTILQIDWFNSFRSVLTWIESEEATLIISDDTEVSYTDTSPENLNYIILKGGYLNIDAGVTLTVSGYIDVGDYDYKSGSGTLVYNDIIYERSGIIYYPDSSITDHMLTTNNNSLQSILTTAAVDEVTCTIKFLDDESGVDTLYNCVTAGTLTFPDYVYLDFEPGAELVPDSGVTIAFYSPGQIHLYGDTQDFIDISNDGTVTYEHPELGTFTARHCGAIGEERGSTGSGSTVNAAALTNWFNHIFSNNYSMYAKLGAGEFEVTTTVTITPTTTTSSARKVIDFDGGYIRQTGITAGNYVVDFDVEGSGCLIRNIILRDWEFRGDSPAYNGTLSNILAKGDGGWVNLNGGSSSSGEYLYGLNIENFKTDGRLIGSGLNITGNVFESTITTPRITGGSGDYDSADTSTGACGVGIRIEGDAASSIDILYPTIYGGDVGIAVTDEVSDVLVQGGTRLKQARWGDYMYAFNRRSKICDAHYENVWSDSTAVDANGVYACVFLRPNGVGGGSVNNLYGLGASTNAEHVLHIYNNGGTNVTFIVGDIERVSSQVGTGDVYVQNTTTTSVTYMIKTGSGYGILDNDTGDIIITGNSSKGVFSSETFDGTSNIASGQISITSGSYITAFEGIESPSILKVIASGRDNSMIAEYTISYSTLSGAEVHLIYSSGTTPPTVTVSGTDIRITNNEATDESYLWSVSRFL